MFPGSLSGESSREIRLQLHYFTPHVYSVGLSSRHKILPFLVFTQGSDCKKKPPDMVIKQTTFVTAD